MEEVYHWSTNRQLHGVAGTWTSVFPMATADFTEEEELLSRTMMKYWTNFARYG